MDGNNKQINNFRYFVNNTVKALLVLAACNIIGYCLYLFMLNTKNMDFPQEAAGGTIVLGIVIFALTLWGFVFIATLGSSDSNRIDEKTLIEQAYRESDYKMDFKRYFIKQQTTRFLGYYLVIILSHIPIFINYFIVSLIDDIPTVYQSPISTYKFFMSNIFGYELFGDMWYLGLFVHLAIFITVFAFSVYKKEKSWLFKPSYIK